MREKIRNVLVTMLAFIVTLSTVGTAVPVTVQAAAKTAAVNKSITLATSKTPPWIKVNHRFGCGKI